MPSAITSTTGVAGRTTRIMPSALPATAGAPRLRAMLAVMSVVLDSRTTTANDPLATIHTVSSVVRILERKGYVGFKAYGKTYEYFPLISKMEYRAASLKRMLAQYFDNSPTALVSFMVEETLSQREKQQLLDLLHDSETSSSKPDGDAQ